VKKSSSRARENEAPVQGRFMRKIAVSIYFQKKLFLTNFAQRAHKTQKV